MVYLDNASTSFPKPEAVLAALDRFGRNLGGNPGRSCHRLAEAAAAVVTSARAGLAALIGADDPSRIVFTANATDALNIAIRGVLRPGDHVVTTAVEHNSIVRPLNALTEAGIVSVDVAPCDGQARVDPDALAERMRPDTRLVAVTWASNAFGTIQPVADIARIAKERGALVLVDASQAVGAVLVDVREVQADLLAFPGHKALGGPTGTGVLWVRPGVEVVPLREGGSGGDTSSPRHPRTWPDRLEAGTLNTFGIAGLGAGVSWIRERTVEAIRAEETALIGRMLDGLRSIPGVQVFGPAGAADRVGVVSFRVPGYTAQEADAVLALSFDIAVRPGLHCAPGAHRSLGTWPDGTVRASLGPMSTANDVDVLVAAVGEMVAARIG